MKPHRGTLILVLGILGLILCPILGIVAWVMGNGDLKEIAAGTMDPAGKDLTKIGKILGIIGTVWLALIVIGFILTMVLGIGAAALGGAQ
jgi:hypothetical protein